MSVRVEEVLAALATVKDPELGRDLVSLGMIQNVRIEDGVLRFRVELTTPACPLKSVIKADCERAVASLPGVSRVEIEMGARVQKLGRMPGAQDEAALLPEVAQVVLVGSGKGGVGKSTVALNLALGLLREGARVGLLDADVYGPSIPTLLGLEGQRAEVAPDNEHLLPTDYQGLKVMSAGFLMTPGQPVIWRGPMLAGIIVQFLSDVQWGALDYLIVDLPPGTGDVQLTLSQKINASGAVLVTTPQEVALADVRRAKVMFDKVGVPVLGFVENMSLFVCPSCGVSHAIFPQGGGERAAREFGLPLLARLPLLAEIAASGDNGRPLLLAEPQSQAAQLFMELARSVAAALSLKQHG